MIRSKVLAIFLSTALIFNINSFATVIEPNPHPGNDKDNLEFKIDPPEDTIFYFTSDAAITTSPSAIFVTIDYNEDTEEVGFVATGCKVLWFTVKGGNGFNKYEFDPGGVSEYFWMRAPVNSSGGPADISHFTLGSIIIDIEDNDDDEEEDNDDNDDEEEDNNDNDDNDDNDDVDDDENDNSDNDGNNDNNNDDDDNNSNEDGDNDSEENDLEEQEQEEETIPEVIPPIIEIPTVTPPAIEIEIPEALPQTGEKENYLLYSLGTLLMLFGLKMKMK